MTCQQPFGWGKIGRLGLGHEQVGHLIRPFSLHAVHERRSPPNFCEKILWLPLHSPHRINLYPPHVPHVPDAGGGSPSTIFFSSPISFKRNTSSAQPTYLRPMNTAGNVTFSPENDVIFIPSLSRSSDMKPGSIDTSRSSMATRKPCRMERTARQASNVVRTTRRLV